MPKGPLRRSVENLAKTFGSDEGEQSWWDKVKERHQEFTSWEAQAREKNVVETKTENMSLMFQYALYVLTGADTFSSRIRELSRPLETEDFSRKAADAIAKIFEHPVASEIVETMGAIITEPVITLFENYAAQDDPDPHEFARAFHGFMIGLNVTAGIADTTLEMITGGQVEGAGRMIESMYWSLGLGFWVGRLWRHYSDRAYSRRLSAIIRNFIAINAFQRQRCGTFTPSVKSASKL